MSKLVLITGGIGFLGRNTAKKYKESGFNVIGIGNGKISTINNNLFGFDRWEESPITLSSLLKLSITPDIIVHCAGSGSVMKTFEDPYKEFQKSVESTASVLEFMRKRAPKAKLIFPSSPAVHGIHGSEKIKITDKIDPMSLYGLYKKFSEEICSNYRDNYNLNISIIRFFSIYGEGLQKQLLWDACKKLRNTNDIIEFWGTGEETRDFIHIDDATELILKTSLYQENIHILNGGTGESHSTNYIINKLKQLLNVESNFIFNMKNKAGDPKYYCADINETKILNWKPMINLEVGLTRYVDWFVGKQ